MEYGETNDDEMEQDDLQIIDTSVKQEEDKGKQPAAKKNIDVQTDDLAIGQSNVTISLSIHDDIDGEP